MKFETTGRARVQSVRCCVLFDRSNGTIRHVHRVVTMEGAEETPQGEIERRALRFAKDLGVVVSRIAPLHVDPDIFEAGKRYMVDPRTRRLKEAPSRTTGSKDSRQQGKGAPS